MQIHGLLYFSACDTNGARLPSTHRGVGKVNCGINSSYGPVNFIAEVFPVLEIRRFLADQPQSAIGPVPPGFGMLPGAHHRANTYGNSISAGHLYRIASGGCRWQSTAP